jgi:hypothetical protein
MELDFAFLASAADASDGGQFGARGGGFNVVESERFPCAFQAALVLKVAAPSPQSEERHNVTIVLCQSDGSRTVLLEKPLLIRPRRFPTSGVLLVVNIGAQLPAPGDYAFAILLDGVERKLLPLYVRNTSEGSD